MTKAIAWLTSILFLLVAIGSFALSYNALRAIAIANGIPDNWLGDIWPLLVDCSLIVFSLAVVNAHLYSESTRKQWVLVTIYTIATVMFNMLHAPDTLLARVIAAIPPISLFFSFELLMEQLRNSVIRKGATHEVSTDTPEVVPSDTQGDIVAIPHSASSDPISLRRDKVLSLKRKQVTQVDMAKELGVSIATIRKDIKALNGKAIV
jgi:hypothetical protein